MTYIISKEFHFSAAHRLFDLQPGHKCMRNHGHNYRVIVEVQASNLDEHGFVVDYAQLSSLGQFITATLDHQDLNIVLPQNGGPSQPTAENIAYWLASKARSLCDIPANGSLRIGISETQSTWAWADEESGVGNERTHI